MGPAPSGHRLEPGSPAAPSGPELNASAGEALTIPAPEVPGAARRAVANLLGADPARSYAASAEAAAAAFLRPGALDAPCAVSYGPVSGSVYAGHRFIDVLIHGWDLATATGQGTALDARLMETCRQIIRPQLETFRRAGALAAELPVPPGATAQTRFLAMLGRSG